MRGTAPGALRVAVAEKRLLILHRGWYVDAAVWRAWYPEQRQAAVAIAVARARRGGEIVASHTCAVALHGLPFYRFAPVRAHVSGPTAAGATKQRSIRAAGGAGRAVVLPPKRHEAEIGDQGDVIEGIPVTNLARTVADTVGRLPLAAAVAIADAALRRVAVDAFGHYAPEAAEQFRAEILACTALRRGARASVQGRWVVAFADGRAASPGESVSRLYLHQLGFAAPRLQVRIDHDAGYYEVDFGLDDVASWGEFDGEGKYTDAEMLDGATTAQALLAEKRREDHIRAITGRGFYRWGWADLKTLETFRLKLESFGVFPPGGPGATPPTFGGARL